MTATTDTLPDDPGTLKAMLLAERARTERLEQIIKELQRHRFGRRAETLPEDQLLLGLEEAEQTAASGEAENEAAAPTEWASHAAKRRINRGSLPAHLPRIEVLSSTSMTRAAPVARASCTGSARTGASGSTSYRRSSGWWSPGGPNTPADRARTVSCKPWRRRG